MKLQKLKKVYSASVTPKFIFNVLYLEGNYNFIFYHMNIFLFGFTLAMIFTDIHLHLGLIPLKTVAGRKLVDLGNRRTISQAALDTLENMRNGRELKGR